MTDGVQPGTKINEETWQRFREEVERRRGGVRGHLKTELERALHGYIQGGDTTPSKIDARLQRIEAAVGVAPSDGGVDTFEPPEHTHAPDEKPAPNGPRDKKVRYLAAQLKDDLNVDATPDEVTGEKIRDVVKDEYAFRGDTARKYVDAVADHLGLVAHPIADGLLVTEDRHAEIVEQEREQTDAELDDL